MRILVRAPNWLGDAILSLPAVRAVRKHADQLIIMAKPPVVDLYHGLADRILDARWPLRAAIKNIQECAPDSVLLFQNSFYSALVPRLAGCRDIWGYDTYGRKFLLSRAVKPPRDIYSDHQIYYHWRLATSLGLAQGEPQLSLQISDVAVLDGTCPWIGMSPGAKYGEAKRWPATSYVRLGMALAARGYRIALFGSGTEMQACQSIADAIGVAAQNLAGRTTVPQLIAGVSQCSLLVTNDSGPLHIASALRVPVVAIFGSTEPRSTGPFGTHSIVLRRDLPCSPCHLRACPIDHRCMTRIHPEEVLDAVIRLSRVTSLEH